MQIYRGTVNVGQGLVRQEIKRGYNGNDQMTAAEVALLRALHGEDAVYGLELMGDAKIIHSRERRRLELRYGEKFVEQLWGASQMNTRLPEAVSLEPESARDVQDMPDDPANFGNLDIPPIEGEFGEGRGEKAFKPADAPPVEKKPIGLGARGRKKTPAADLDLEPIESADPPPPSKSIADAFADA